MNLAVKFSNDVGRYATVTEEIYVLQKGESLVDAIMQFVGPSLEDKFDEADRENVDEYIERTKREGEGLNIAIFAIHVFRKSSVPREKAIQSTLDGACFSRRGLEAFTAKSEEIVVVLIIRSQQRGELIHTYIMGG